MFAKTLLLYDVNVPCFLAVCLQWPHTQDKALKLFNMQEKRV